MGFVVLKILGQTTRRGTQGETLEARIVVRCARRSSVRVEDIALVAGRRPPRRHGMR